MKDILGLATTVATPLALLGLVATVAFYAYQRRLRSVERTLALLPPEQRAANIDDYLTRYGIEGKNFTRDQKFQLIKEEMDRRHRQASISKMLAAAVFAVCFVVAAIAYTFHDASAHPSADPGNKQPPPSEPPAKLARLAVRLERMKLAGPSGRQLGTQAYTDKDKSKVVQKAARWVEETLREQFPQTSDFVEFEVAVVARSSGPGKTIQITPSNPYIPSTKVRLRQEFFWSFAEVRKQDHHLLDDADPEIQSTIEQAAQLPEAKRPPLIVHIDQPGYRLKLAHINLDHPVKIRLDKSAEPAYSVILDNIPNQPNITSELRTELGQGLLVFERSELAAKSGLVRNSHKPGLKDEQRLSELENARSTALVTATFEEITP